MQHQVTVTLLGGDMRQIAVAERLFREGFSVRSFGLPKEKFGEEILCFEDWKEAVCGADCVILPLPASPDSMRISTPLMPHVAPPLFTELFAALPKKMMVAGGRFSPAVHHMAHADKRKLYDYFENESLQQKNALLTAEGAVSLLMQTLPRTVSGMRVAITGFGRVSKALVKLLTAMGASVTVAARKKSDIETASACGCGILHLQESHDIKALSCGYDAVFNTVPHLLFETDYFAIADPKTLYIDLASSPGGIDAAAAAERKVQVIWALSLPGKYAPQTAGEIIAEAIVQEMKEEGIV